MMSKVYLTLALMAVCGSALAATYFVGDARGYTRHQQEQLTAQIRKQNEQTVQRRASRARIAALQLELKEQQEKDDVKNRQMLESVKSYRIWWNDYAHVCGIAYAFGLPNDDCNRVRTQPGERGNTGPTKTPSWVLYKRILSGDHKNNEGRKETGQPAETRATERN